MVTTGYCQMYQVTLKIEQTNKYFINRKWKITKNK